jgi:hypothetical protein
MSYSPRPSKLAARPFSGKKNPTRAPKLLNSDGLYGKSLVIGIDAPSGPKVSRILDLFGRRRRFVRPTAHISLRNCSPYVRLNGTSSVSCNTVGFLCKKGLPTAGIICEAAAIYPGNIIVFNNLAPYSCRYYLAQNGQDARSPFTPRRSDRACGIGLPRRCVWVQSTFLLPDPR